MYRLTCRARGRGRGIVPIQPVPGTPDPGKADLDRWVLLIHGFNNSSGQAGTTWTITLRELARIGADQRNLVLFYWPGDYGRNRLWSAMNYPRTVPTAEETAQLLAEYLHMATRDRRIPLQLSLVAHSLGSLVVLHTLVNLRDNGANVDVREVLLMAAAVPEGFCLANEMYGRKFAETTREQVLYSLSDGALKTAFRVGHKLSGRIPRDRQRAVGRTGGPGAGEGERWTSATHMEGFDHGDYWKSPLSIARIARVTGSAPTWFEPREDARVKSAKLRVDVVPENDERHRDPGPLIDEPFTNRASDSDR